MVGFLLAIEIGQFALVSLAEKITQLSSLLLISGFCIFLVAGIIQLNRLILAAVGDYFSSLQRSERKLWYLINQRNNLIRLFQLKKTRLLHENQQKRKHLSQLNNH